MNTSQSRPPHLSYVATLLWEIQKVIFQHYYSYTSNYLVTSEENNSNYCTTALAVYVLLFNVPIICIVLLLSLGHATGGARVLIWTCKGCSLLRHGLNFITAWCTVRLISAEKDWKHVLTQKVVTLNTCCDIACLTFQLSHITTGSFRSH